MDHRYCKSCGSSVYSRKRPRGCHKNYVTRPWVSNPVEVEVQENRSQRRYFILGSDGLSDMVKMKTFV